MQSLFHFDRFTLDLDRGELSRDERPVTLRPCAFRVLAYLVQHAGRVVGRDELFDHIWSGVVVADGSLTQSIWEVRRALEGAGDGQDFIRTRRGSGYCFTAAVRPTGREGREELVAAYDALVALTQRLALTDLELDARLARAECMRLERDSAR